VNLYIKYDIHQACRIILEEQLDKLGIEYELIGLGEVEIKKDITPDQLQQLNTSLNKYGIEIVDNQKSTLVQKIKDTITEMVWLEDKLPTSKISSYIAEKLSHSYGYLSNLFSEVTYTSIENYIIIQKIERAKQMIISDELTLTEISYRLNYSSVAHLSTQFKKTTGLTPSAFQRIIKKRRSNHVAQ
jgi:AraC-like DNA-binding protein